MMMQKSTDVSFRLKDLQRLRILPINYQAFLKLLKQKMNAETPRETVSYDSNNATR
jgi:hypothetical protein